MAPVTATSLAKAQIRQLINEFSTAVMARDLDRMLASYAADAVIFDATPARLSIGPEQYRTHWQQFFDMLDGPVRHETRDLTVIADGDLAVAHALAHTAATQTNGKRMEMWFRVSLAFRNVDGRWLVTHEHSSVPFEPQSMRAAVDLRP
jgi:uncharacterized protein (TIGR02246 family)